MRSVFAINVFQTLIATNTKLLYFAIDPKSDRCEKSSSYEPNDQSFEKRQETGQDRAFNENMRFADL